MITVGQLYIVILVIVIVCVVFCRFIIQSEQKNSYKQGQIDAMNCKWKIKLVEFEDGAREYYYEKDLKELEYYTVIK